MNAQSFESGFQRDPLERLEKPWTNLDSDPLLVSSPEYQQISAEARSTKQRMQLSMNLPNGGEALQQGGTRLHELYQEAVKLRARIVEQRLTGRFAYANVGLSDGMLQQYESLTGNLNPIEVKALSPLQGIAKQFNVTGVTDQNYKGGFLQMYNGNAVPHFGRIRAAEEKLKTIQSIPGLMAHAGMGEYVGNLQAGLAELRSIDPVRDRWDQWKQNFEASKGAYDWRPLRGIGAIGGGLIATLGFALAAKDSWHSVSKGGGLVIPTWPTFLWTGVAFMSANPSYVRSLWDGSAGAQAQMQWFQMPHVRELAETSFFKGSHGTEAFQELQQLAGNPQFRRYLKSGQPVLPATLGQFADQNGPLMQSMMGLPVDQRMQALQTFGRRMNQNEQELFSELIRTRNQFAMG